MVLQLQMLSTFHAVGIFSKMQNDFEIEFVLRTTADAI